MALVDAYDTVTGKKLPHLVPEHHFDHPILGRRISKLPSQKAPKERKSATTAAKTPANTIPETPASGDHPKE